MQRRHVLHTLAAGAAAITLPALAQTWPVRPIKLVVPFPAGSSPDIVARIVAEPLGVALGQGIVVDNRPGAGGNIGTGAVAKAEPDGYTFVFTIQGPLVTAPLLSKNLGYDPAKDLAPVTLVATSPNVLVVEPGLGVNTLAEFVRVSEAAGGPAQLRQHRQRQRLAPGDGAVQDACRDRPACTCPTRASRRSSTRSSRGQVQAGFMVPGIAMGQVRAGKLKALGVTTLGRVASLPELPTFAEQGYAGFEAISWQAVLAPAKTPRAIIERVSRELIRIIKSDAVRTRLLGQYFSAAGTTPEALAGLMKSERTHWARVIKAAGVQPE